MRAYISLGKFYNKLDVPYSKDISRCIHFYCLLDKDTHEYAPFVDYIENETTVDRVDLPRHETEGWYIDFLIDYGEKYNINVIQRSVILLNAIEKYGLLRKHENFIRSLR